MTAPSTDTAPTGRLDPALLGRILQEGFGPGAWHGPDLKAALADVTPAVAFRRPGPERHNVAEIAMHHAWCVHSVADQLTGSEGQPFPLPGADWFPLANERDCSWASIADTLETEQRRLAAAIADLAAGRRRSPLGDAQCFDLVLGITCHAIYHAGQIQLVKRLVM